MSLSNPRYKEETIYSLALTSPVVSTLTLVDDGDYGPLGFAPASYSVAEPGNGTEVGAPVFITLTVTRTQRARPSGNITVDFATIFDNTTTAGPDDFFVTNGRLEMEDGQAQAFITFGVKDDFEFEFPDEVAKVRLDNILYRNTSVRQYFSENRTAAVTILDDGDAGFLTFDRESYSIEEQPAGAQLRITVTRTGRQNYTNLLEVSYATIQPPGAGTNAAPNVKYTPKVGKLPFGPFVFSQVFEITIGDGAPALPRAPQVLLRSAHIVVAHRPALPGAGRNGRAPALRCELRR